MVKLQNSKRTTEGSNLSGLGVAPYCGSGDGRMLVGYYRDLFYLFLLHSLSSFSLSFFDIMHGVVGAPKPWIGNLPRRTKTPKSNHCCLAVGLGEGNSNIKPAAYSTSTILIYSMSRGYKVVDT